MLLLKPERECAAGGWASAAVQQLQWEPRFGMEELRGDSRGCFQKEGGSSWVRLKNDCVLSIGNSKTIIFEGKRMKDTCNNLWSKKKRFCLRRLGIELIHKVRI